MKKKIYRKHPLLGIRDYVSKSYVFHKNKSYSYWVAIVDSAKIHFSINKYGNKAAFEMASFAAKRLYKQLRRQTLKISK